MVADEDGCERGAEQEGGADSHQRDVHAADEAERPTDERAEQCDPERATHLARSVQHP